MGLFITGTDTGCGKTEITLGLMRRFQDRGLTVLGMKPVASGCERTSEGLRNPDALRIQDQGSLAVPYELMNPFAYEPPIAPHIAAAEARRPIRPEAVRNCYEALAELSDLVIVEGVGGWRVPLGPEFAVPDLPRLLDLQVVLVVGLRLGCLNHALLTAESIAAAGFPLAGWVANQVEPDMARVAENVRTLEGLIPAPFLGQVPSFAKEPSPGSVAPHIDIASLSG